MAADAALDLAKAERHHTDFLVYPILFLYRQYLEISLKEILLYAEELRDGNMDIPGTHNFPVQELVPQLTVEALVVAVLPRTTWLDIERLHT